MPRAKDTKVVEDEEIEDDPQADGDEEPEEFEIEAILNAKPGMFEQVHVLKALLHA